MKDTVHNGKAQFCKDRIDKALNDGTGIRFSDEERVQRVVSQIFNQKNEENSGTLTRNCFSDKNQVRKTCL
jgi:hypothetical protein